MTLLIVKGPILGLQPPSIHVVFQSDGRVAFYNGSTWIDVDAYSDSSWTKLDIAWRSSDHTARYRVNDGTWTNWMTFDHASSFTDFDVVGIDFERAGIGSFYLDSLQ